jgi:hypothetical protein
MNHTWVLSTLCDGFALDAIVYAVPHAQTVIEQSLFRNGDHGIAPWRSYSAPLGVVKWLTTNDLESGKRTHHV